MVTEKKNLPHSRVKLTITVSADQFQASFTKELEDIAKDVQVEGFRKGKAPAAKVIASVGRQRIEAGALDRAVSDAYYEGMREKNLIPVEGPNVEITDFTAPAENALGTEKVATFTVEVDVLPEIELKNYKKIKVKPPKEEKVEEKDVDEVIDYLRRQRAALKEADKNLTVANGVWADIAFTGSVDGVAREDMKSEHHPLVVGEGQLIPGFEEEMIGMKTGEKKTFTVTFPKDYRATDLAGKKAEFTVTINELKELVMPELDRDFTQPLGHDSVEALRAAIKENLHEEREHQRQHKVEELVIEELLKQAKFEIPQALVRQEEERIMGESRAQVEQMGMTWEQYLEQTGKTQDGLQEELHGQAEKNVRIGLALGKVVQEEKIEDRELAMRLAVEKLVEYAVPGWVSHPHNHA